jgi:acyl-CoA thioesterase
VISAHTDKIFLGMATYANPDKVGNKVENVTMVATLSHTISFHDPTVKVDEWMVLERTTSWGGNGRVRLHQLTWDLKTGRLIMSCEQEALKDNNSKL